MSRSVQPPDAQRLYDEFLVLAVLSGEARAAEQLARRWRPRLLRTARRLLGDADRAEDVVQDTWLAIARGLPGLREPGRFPAWAFGILNRRCADAHRRRYRDSERLDTLTDQTGATEATGESRSALDSAFASLPETQRLTAILFYGEGLTLAEIARVTNVPVGTAKSRLFHARRQLREQLEDHST
ncbi:MAG: sigma-70 family RNA polymerase sigma factor [Pseudomonadota bacterium]